MMQNFLISFNEEANDLQFEEYFFNGFPRPYDIAFKYDEFINIEWKFKNELIKDYEPDSRILKFLIVVSVYHLLLLYDWYFPTF